MTEKLKRNNKSFTLEIENRWEELGEWLKKKKKTYSKNDAALRSQADLIKSKTKISDKVIINANRSLTIVLCDSCEWNNKCCSFVECYCCDCDQRIVVSWLVEDFKKEQGIDLMQDIMAIQRLREAAEKAKIELSTVMESEINLPFITVDASGPKHFIKTISRSQLENLSLIKDCDCICWCVAMPVYRFQSERPRNICGTGIIRGTPLV